MSTDDTPHSRQTPQNNANQCEVPCACFEALVQELRMVDDSLSILRLALALHEYAQHVPHDQYAARDAANRVLRLAAAFHADFESLLAASSQRRPRPGTSSEFYRMILNAVQERKLTRKEVTQEALAQQLGYSSSTVKRKIAALCAEYDMSWYELRDQLVAWSHLSEQERLEAPGDP